MSTAPVTTTSSSLKPRRGRSWKRLQRIRIVAELEAKFIQDSEIAAHLGITVGAVQAIKRSQEYTSYRVAAATGTLTVYESMRLTTEEAQKDELQTMIPNALNAVRSILSDKTHPHFAKVALDLLDRVPSTSKVSRINHSVSRGPDISQQDRENQELLELLGKPSTSEPFDPSTAPATLPPMPPMVEGPSIDPSDEEIDKAVEEAAEDVI